MLQGVLLHCFTTCGWHEGLGVSNAKESALGLSPCPPARRHGRAEEGAQRVRCPGLTSLSTICGKTWCSTGSSRARPDATCHTEGRKGEAAVRSVVSEAASEWSSGEVERERRERESGSGWGRARQSRGKRKRWGKREGAVRRGEVGRGAAGERLSPSCSVAARGGGAAGEQPLQRGAAPRAARA